MVGRARERSGDNLTVEGSSWRAIVAAALSLELRKRSRRVGRNRESRDPDRQTIDSQTVHADISDRETTRAFRAQAGLPRHHRLLPLEKHLACQIADTRLILGRNDAGRQDE